MSARVPNPTESEERLRRRLHRAAETTQTSPDGLATILERATSQPAPAAWPRRVLVGAVAAVAVSALALVLVAPNGNQESAELAGGTGAPPAIEGEIVGLVQDSDRCTSDVCPGSDVMRLELPSLTFGRATTGARIASVAVGPDGGVLATTKDGSGLVEVGTASVMRLPLLPEPVAVAIGPAGEQATVHTVVEGGASSGPTTYDLRLDGELLITGAADLSAPAFDPAGRLAVLQAFTSPRSRFHDAELVVFDRVTEVARRRIEGVPPDGVLNERPVLSWSGAGLVAISRDRMDSFQGVSGNESLNTTLIVDPATGATVRTIEGWHGLAWSPDGTGLLLTRPVAPRTTEVAVAYGSTMGSIDIVGTVSDYVTGLFWRAPSSTTVEVDGATYDVTASGLRTCLRGGLLGEPVCRPRSVEGPDASLDPGSGGNNVLFVVAPKGVALVSPDGASVSELSGTGLTVLVDHVAGDEACVGFTRVGEGGALLSVTLTRASDPSPSDPTATCR